MPRSSLPLSPLPFASAFISRVLGATDFFLAMLAPGLWSSLAAVYISIGMNVLVPPPHDCQLVLMHS